MTAPASFHDEMETAARAGLPNLDNAGDPDALGAYGLEEDGDPLVCEECGDQVGWLSRRGLCDDCDDAAEEEAAP